MHPSLTLALALLVGVVAQSAARHLRIPGIVLLLLAGTGLGPDVLGWIEPQALGAGLFAIVDLAVAVILFEGALNLEVSRLRREQTSIRRLVTLGALVTMIGGTLATRWILGWSWSACFLFGSLVVVTGPTVIGPLVSELRLRPRVATVLEAEGVLIDPIGAILAVLVLELTLAPDADSLAAGAADLILRLGFGAATGAAAGLLLAQMLRVRRLLPQGHENIFVLASVLLLFEACDLVVSHSGIVAVTVAGVVVGNLKSRVDRDLREFKDQLTVMLIGLLFVTLAADVRIEQVRSLGWSGLAVVGALVLVVRPLNVWVSTLTSDLSLRERLFIAWIAPRGIVAAAVASLVASATESGGLELRALVFLTIAGTVLQAGLTAGVVGRWLGVRLPGRETVAILGAQGLGLALADALRAAGRPVIFLDANPQNCRRAEEAGFPVVYGNALDERTLLRARAESVGATVAATPNQTVNSVFVTRARELFGVPRGYVAVERPQAGLVPELVEHEHAEILFDAPHDVERWDVRARHGDLEVLQRVYRPDGKATEEETGESNVPAPGRKAPARGSERFAILAVRRGRAVEPMSTRFRPRAGDVAAVAVYAPERAEALASLEQLGWAEPEPEPEKPEATGEEEG